MCPARPHGEPQQTPQLIYSLRPLNQHDYRILSIVFLLPGPVQLLPATLRSRNSSQFSGLTSACTAPYGIAGYPPSDSLR